LVQEMCSHDLADAEKEALVKHHGYRVPSRIE
jgi:hypothetical protein